MFDLKNIDFIKSDEQHGRKAYSFVGLKRKENSERLEFWLPLGFDDFETDVNNPKSFDRVKGFFFKMYRTFQVYRERKLNQLTEEERTTDRDGVFEFENGFSFVNENNEEIVFYGKLNALDKILDGFDELRISSLEKKQVRSTEIDYSKIHKYMHQAIYLDEDVIYLDEMNIAKSVLIQESPPIIQLFCFIYTEIKRELEETDSISDKAFELAEKFKDAFLQANSSLFAEDTFADTINILKNVFEEIDNKTTYKDEDFWHFYEAIEAFLTGERKDDKEGVYFGINNFYDIWEDLCQTYILSNPDYLPKVLFADVKGKLLTRKDLYLMPELETNPFRMKINNYQRERFLKPDLVLSDKYEQNIYTVKQLLGKKQTQNFYGVFLIKPYNFPKRYDGIKQLYYQLISKEKNNKKQDEDFIYMLEDNFRDFEGFVHKILLQESITIIDYKYMRQSDYEKYNPNAIGEKGENKIKDDIHKQLIYEWAVQQNFENSETRSEFWIPYYVDDLDLKTSKQELNIKNPYFLPSQIKVVKVNFKIFQENYVKLSTAL